MICEENPNNMLFLVSLSVVWCYASALINRIHSSNVYSEIRGHKNGVITKIFSYSFLQDRSQDTYIRTITNLATRNIQKCLNDDVKLIEVAFPEFRKADMNVVESLEVNRKVSSDLATSIKKDILMVLPEASELKYSTNTQLRTTSIERLYKAVKETKDILLPSVLIVVNPGFNVEEWITLANTYSILKASLNPDQLPTVIIVNGNLARLRSGYYPRLFYPALYAVSTSFYSQFTPALSLSNVAVSGEAFGCFLVKQYVNSEYEVLVRTAQGGYEVQKTYPPTALPPPTALWREANNLFIQARKGL